MPGKPTYKFQNSITSEELWMGMKLSNNNEASVAAINFFFYS